MIYGPYPAVVVRNHDGDTSVLELDLGFGLKLILACRYYGINAPELSTPEGKVSRDYLNSILPAGAQVTVTSYGWDKYGGRFDGVIFYDNLNVNQKIVSTGHAVSIT